RGARTPLPSQTKPRNQYTEGRHPAGGMGQVAQGRATAPSAHMDVRPRGCTIPPVGRRPHPRPNPRAPVEFTGAGPEKGHKKAPPTRGRSAGPGNGAWGGAPFLDLLQGKGVDPRQALHLSRAI